MTEQEAMEIIMQVAYDGEFPLNSNEAFGIACKCIEKQIPKKPYIQQVEVEDYDRDCLECPSCDSFIGYASECTDEHYQENYCPCCGQMLDWSDFN